MTGSSPKPDRFIRSDEVFRLTGYKRSSIDRFVKAGTFPAPARAGKVLLLGAAGPGVDRAAPGCCGSCEMNAAAAYSNPAASTGQGHVFQTFGYAPTSLQVRRVAEHAIGLGWTDPATPEGTALAAALSAETDARQLHYLLLLACGAGNIAGKAMTWISSRFPPDAVIEITAIVPVGGRVSVYGRMDHPDEVARMAAFIATWWGCANLYYGVNPRGEHMIGSNRAANARDVVSRHQLVFDHDDGPIAPEERLRWEEEVLSKHRADWIAGVVRSGNGLQVIYDLEVETGNQTVVGRQALLQQIYRSVGADTAVANADRVFRLPYTINIPNPSKRKKGRTLVLATVLMGITNA